MLAHDFVEMPGRLMDIDDNPFKTVMLLRCSWCKATPAKAREDGCAARELATLGKIVLHVFNPDGAARFQGRECITCHNPIMDHWLRNDGTQDYFCMEDGTQTSDGITDCVWDVPEGLGNGI